MDIVKLKATIAEYDQQEKRMPVYECLKEAWASEPPSEQLTVLVMVQMLLYVYRLEIPYETVPEVPNEYNLYEAFLTEAATYGFEYYRKGKMFLWEMCRVLDLWPMYYFKCKYVPELTGQQVFEQLLAEAKALYPTSALFDCLTIFDCLTDNAELISSLTPVQRQRIREELAEWNLQKNWADREILDSFRLIMTDDGEKANGTSNL